MLVLNSHFACHNIGHNFYKPVNRQFLITLFFHSQMTIAFGKRSTHIPERYSKELKTTLSREEQHISKASCYHIFRGSTIMPRCKN